MKIKDIMTQSVASLNSDDSVEHAAQLMKQFNIGAIPVCSEEKVIGIVTDRDIALRSVAEGENTKRQVVRDIMTSNPVYVGPDADIHEAARIMSERQIRRLPVVEDRNLVGMVSLGDMAVEPKYGDNAGRALSGISTPSVQS